MAALIEMFHTNPWLWPAVLFAGGLFAGLIFEYVALPIVMRITKRTNWELDDIFIGSLRGIGLIWLVCAGSHLAVHAMPIKRLPVTVLEKTTATTKVIIDANAVSTTAAQGVAEKIDVIGVLDNILLVLFIGSVTIYTMRIAVAALALYTKKSGRTTQGVTLFTNVTKVVIIILGALMTVQAFGYSVTPILTALGVGGLAVALALQDTLSNLFAGFHIIASHQIKPGDYIKLEGGHEGYVADINWRNTTIKALASTMIIVPNSKMASAIITNFDKPDKEIGVGLEVTVSRDNDLEKVERVTCDVANKIIKTVPGIVDTGPAAIKYSGFTDFGAISFGVGFRIKAFTDQYLVKHEFLKALHARYKAEGIELAIPERLVESRGQAGKIS